MNSRTLKKILQFCLIVAIAIAMVWVINTVGVERLRASVDQLGVWAPVGVFALRFTSVVVPALPGTAYSVLAGGLFGLPQGLLVICLADLASCSLSFFLSRQYGRGFIQRFVGDRFMTRIDRLSQQHLENNFFLMTGFLMTGFFDFVAYSVGLTQTPWTKFLPALVISIAVSNPPIVAFGAGLLEGGKVILGFAILGMIGLAIVTGLVQRRQQKTVQATPGHLETSDSSESKSHPDRG